jgi:hypothetical protein
MHHANQVKVKIARVHYLLIIKRKLNQLLTV